MGVQKMESVYQLQKLVNDMDDDKFLQAECLLCNYTQNSWGTYTAVNVANIWSTISRVMH